MSKKSKFLKSATLAIAGVALISGLSSCKMFGCKDNCHSKKESSAKEGKAKSSSKAKEGKAKCSSKKDAKKAE